MEINTASPLVCQENSLQNRGRFNKINGQNQKNICLIKIILEATIFFN
jgi:hypothetical protein